MTPSVTRGGVIWLFVLATGFYDPLSLWASSPAEQMRTSLSRIVRILKDPEWEGDLKRMEKREQLRKTIVPIFDFREMAKRSLGIHWHRHAARRQELVAPFAKVVQDFYFGWVELYPIDKIIYSRERLEQGFAEVNTRMVSRTGDNLLIDYRLQLIGAQWKVYDVLIDRTSLVNHYRSQFHRILSRSKFEVLLEGLESRSEPQQEPVGLRLDRRLPYLLLSDALRGVLNANIRRPN